MMRDGYPDDQRAGSLALRVSAQRRNSAQRVVRWEQLLDCRHSHVWAAGRRRFNAARTCAGPCGQSQKLEA